MKPPVRDAVGPGGWAALTKPPNSREAPTWHSSYGGSRKLCRPPANTSAALEAGGNPAGQFYPRQHQTDSVQDSTCPTPNAVVFARSSVRPHAPNQNATAHFRGRLLKVGKRGRSNAPPVSESWGLVDPRCFHQQEGVRNPTQTAVLASHRKEALKLPRNSSK